MDAAIEKLREYTALAESSLGEKDVTRGARKATREVKELEFFMRPVTDEMEILRFQMATLVGTPNIPTMNREMRIILGQLPGMRTAIQQMFRLKRLQREMGMTITTGVPTMGLYLTIIATMIIIMRGVLQQMRQMQRRQREQRRWIRNTMGLSREEYDRKLKMWAHYARSDPG